MSLHFSKIMKQIADSIFIENTLRGVTVGAIATQQGIFCVDTPTSAIDARKWRLQLSQWEVNHQWESHINAIIYTDGHYDRILGAQWLEAPVIAHELTAQRMAEYPDVFRAHHALPGGDYEMVNDLTGVQIVRPRFSFTEDMTCYVGEDLIYLYHVPGASAGQLWVEVASQKVIFVGDSVILTAHPWIGDSNFAQWREALHGLESSYYDEYTFVPGRGQPISNRDLSLSLKYLDTLEELLEENQRSVGGDFVSRRIAEQLLERFPELSGRKELMRRRLVNGLNARFTAQDAANSSTAS